MFAESLFFKVVDMKKIQCLFFYLLFFYVCNAQDINSIIVQHEAERIEQILSSDSMEGRKIFTPGIEKAADFISAEFKKTGLQTLNGLNGYRQNFEMLRPKFISLSCTLDGLTIAEKNVVVITAQENLDVTEQSSYEKSAIDAQDNFFQKAMSLMESKKNSIVLVDTSFSKYFGRLLSFKKQLFAGRSNVIFILTNKNPQQYSIKAKHSFERRRLSNIVGVLPGKSLPEEYVIFSAHYDHLGIGKTENNDSIYNGANDDASGTTAVILLAKYFKALGNNARTLIFAAFTAEEPGGLGSQYFSKQLKAEQVMAMLNIEMIGTESKWGRNSAYITGYEKTDMGKILQNNLKGSQFEFHPDPYTAQKLFYRSDNAALARLGVPAHTVSTSKMDDEPNYHKPSDEMGTLDLDNMTEIIKAIALSAAGIVAGRDMPTRVDTGELN